MKLNAVTVGSCLAEMSQSSGQCVNEGRFYIDAASLNYISAAVLCL